VVVLLCPGGDSRDDNDSAVAVVVDKDNQGGLEGQRRGSDGVRTPPLSVDLRSALLRGYRPSVLVVPSPSCVHDGPMFVCVLHH